MRQTDRIKAAEYDGRLAAGRFGRAVGARTVLHQYPGGCDFTMERGMQPEDAEVDAPC